MTSRISRVWRRLDALVDALCSLGCVAIVVISFIAVVCRYVLNSSLTWSEEFTRYLFIWIVFLGAAISVRRRAHIAVDVFVGRLSPLGDRVLSLIERLATIAFALLVGIPGWAFVVIGMSNLSPALEIPMGFVYLAPVVGSVLIVIYALRPPEGPAQRDNRVI